MPFSDLAGRLAGIGRSVRADLTDLLKGFWSALHGSGNPEKMAQEVELRAREGAFLGFEAGAEAQHASLAPGRLPDAFHAVNAAAAVRQAGIVVARAKIVLAERPESYIVPYADLSGQILTTGSMRSGTQAAGTYNGATRKQFIRLRPVQEPRAHSVLEGQILLVDELFNINGYHVYGPGDEALPWSEKAWCGHILRYLK
jgi:hypothetical protein